MRYIPNGWPVNRKLCAGDALLYYNLQHDLPMASGLVMYGSKVVIPYSPRGHVTGLLHAAYQGENKTLQRAQNSIYIWGFCERLEIKQLMSSPLHHSCNGQVERTIDTVKGMMKNMLIQVMIGLRGC